MNEIKIFENDSFGQIRTIEMSGKPYFVANDVAKALEYKNTSDAIDRHCRWVVKHDIPHPQSKNKSITVNVIPEGDLYRLITHSELESAQKFETWVFDEVLPSIRSNGMYATDELLDNPDLLIKVATALKEEREKIKVLETENKVKSQIIGELKPKADYTDTILNNKALVTITQIAKDYGMSGKEMNTLLHTLGIQYKQSEQWLLYSKYHGLGYTHSNTISFTHKDGTPDVTMNTKWTQKGRLFLYEKLKQNRYLPIIERTEIA